MKNKLGKIVIKSDKTDNHYGNDVIIYNKAIKKEVLKNGDQLLGK